MNDKKNIVKETLTKEALKLGFSKIGICKGGTVDQQAVSHYQNWIEDGFHGNMAYMAENITKRFNPNELWEHPLRSVIVLAMNYFSVENDKLLQSSRYKISRYAMGSNYHNVMKKKLKKFCGIFEQLTGSNIKVFVDTAPILEKYWAVQSGVGNIGKNTCLIVPPFGSWVFLAVCITDAELTVDEVLQKDVCGKCRRCIDACPTGALVAPGKLDARRCIACLTVEGKTENLEQAPDWKHWIWGCDICQEVCPHNSKPQETEVSDFHAKHIVKELMDGKYCPITLDEKLKGTSLKRGGALRIPIILKHVGG
jgi:epoxyqueuosine reductase